MRTGINTAVIAICAAALVCALLSHFITDGGTKKLLSLIMGAFIVCAAISPIKNAASGMELDFSGYPSAESLTATADEAYNAQVLSITRQNLEKTLTDILLQEGIEINRAEIVLSLKDETRIIISSVRIYISKATAYKSGDIVRICERDFSVTPNVITE